MNNPEREPQPIASFGDMAYRLPEDEELLLSRNSVQHVRMHTRAETEPVHYEGIDNVSSGDYSVYGDPIQSQFIRAAEHLKGDESYVRKGPAYPTLTVINHTTKAAETKVVDVPDLIIKGRVPMYLVPHRSRRSGETILTDFTPLIKELVKEVGIDPKEALLIDDGVATALRDTDLRTYTYIPKEFDSDDIPQTLSIDPRGDAALALVQMDTAQTFMRSGHRVLHVLRGRVEVVLNVGVRPDIQTVVLSLVDLVESLGLHLQCYKGYVATEETGFVLSVVDDNLDEVASLAGESTLDMAFYNAYNAAQLIFPETNH